MGIAKESRDLLKEIEVFFKAGTKNGKPTANLRNELKQIRKEMKP